jgi:hypothetical protein
MKSPSDRLTDSPANASVPFFMLSRRNQSRIPSHIGSVEPADRDDGRGAGFYQGLFASAKNARSIPWKTFASRDLMCLLETDAHVQSYEPSPECVSFVLDDITRRHVPSFRVRMGQGTAILDALVNVGGSGDRQRRTTEALAEIYADRGIPYRALSIGDIRLQPRFGNAKWILARRGYHTSEREELLVVGELSVQDRLTIAYLEAALPAVENVAAVVCAMAVQGHLTLDLSAPAALDMRVSLNVGRPR